MFSGIIEKIGKIEDIIIDKTNKTFVISSEISSELKIDQSLAHNGVCLTVIKQIENKHWVTAIEETLQKSNIGYLKIGDYVNLERCMRLSDRLDGHIVQGHVDQTGVCTEVLDQNGSWIYSFNYDDKKENITVEKGSICVNGVSLTVVNSSLNTFSVAIIPYTHENTIFKYLQKNDIVNLEFDIIGKYVSKLFLKNN